MKKLILFLVLSISLQANAQEKTTDNFTKTDEVLSKLVQKAVTAAEKTGDFIIEQTPLLLQEFYTWHIAKNSLTLVLLLATFIFLLILRKRFNLWSEKESKDWYDAEYFFGVICIHSGLVISILMFASSIYDLVFILVAPKLYLIEYFIH